jgi:hypothetical protein
MTLTANHPGFWVDWVAPTDSAIVDVALGDADRDGDLDLFVLEGSSLELWRNDGRGGLTKDPAVVCSVALNAFLLLDTDGDSRLDVVVAPSTGGIANLKGLGNGSFSPPTLSSTGAVYQQLVAIDVDNDGTSELATNLAAPGDGLQLVRDWKSNPTIIPLIAGTAVGAIAATDLNEDGWTDLVSAAAEQSSADISMFLNERGNLVLAASADVGGPGIDRILPLDFNGDGHQDIFFAGMYGLIFGVLGGDGTGRGWEARTFPFEFGLAPPGIQVTDLDSNNVPELLIGWRRSDSGAFVSQFEFRTDPDLLNPRIVSYTHSNYAVAPMPPDHILAGDLDGDSRPDLLLASTSAPSVSNYPVGPGMIGVIINREGVPGGIHLQPVDVKAYSVAVASLHPSRSPELFLAGPEGLFQISRGENDSLLPARRIGEGERVRSIDLDHDHRDDLIVEISAGATEVRPTGSRGLGPVSARFEGTVVDAGRLNHDSRLDLVVRRPDGAVDILWGDPRAQFNRTSTTGIQLVRDSRPETPFVVLADADGDGRTELIECRVHSSWFGSDTGTVDTVYTHRILPSGQTQVLRATLVEEFMPPDSHVEMARAANLDGRPGDEIVIMTDNTNSYFSTLQVLRAVGDGSYEHSGGVVLGGENPRDLTLADLDGDQDIDAACITTLGGSASVLHIRWNDGTGQLNEQWSRRIGAPATLGLAVADLDLDDAADIVMVGMPVQDGGSGSTLAFLFGRREEASARVAQMDPLDMASTSPAIGLAIRMIRPNPVRSAFTVQWASQSHEPVSIDLLDVAGRRVSSATPLSGESTASFGSLEGTPAGLYWVRLRQGTQTVTKRVAVIR